MAEWTVVGCGDGWGYTYARTGYPGSPRAVEVELVVPEYTAGTPEWRAWAPTEEDARSLGEAAVVAIRGVMDAWSPDYSGRRRER